MTRWFRPRLRPGETAIVIGGLALVAYLTFDVLAGGVVADLDHQVYDAWGHHSSYVAMRVSGVGSLGVGPPLLAIAALVTCHASWQLWPALAAAGVGAAVTLAVLVMKTLVARPGPGVGAHRVGYAGYFPSGHTATAAVCLGTGAYLLSGAAGRWRSRVNPAAIGLATGMLAGAAVGAMTVVTGNHWASDVVASLALSAVLLTLCFAACRAHLERHPQR